MGEFTLQPVLSLSKYKYTEFLFEYYKDIKTNFDIRLVWRKKVDLAGLRFILSLWRFNLRITFFADKRIWDDKNNEWEKGSEEYFKS